MALLRPEVKELYNRILDNVHELYSCFHPEGWDLVESIETDLDVLITETL